MSTTEWVFLSIGLLGFAVLLTSLLVGHHGDTDVSVHADADSDTAIGDVYTPSWRSVPVLAASLAGFGTGSFLTVYSGSPAIIAILVGLGTMLGLGTIVLLLAQWMSRQQSNSTLSSDSYIGTEAQLQLNIPATGFGQVSFYDQGGNYVSLLARTADNSALPQGAHVLIIGVVNDGVVVSSNPNFPLED